MWVFGGEAVEDIAPCDEQELDEDGKPIMLTSLTDTRKSVTSVVLQTLYVTVFLSNTFSVLATEQQSRVYDGIVLYSNARTYVLYSTVQTYCCKYTVF